jgi:polysaccharide export outer membrane protein
VRVAPDGTVSLPYIGRIQVVGMTEDGLASAFRRTLERRDVVKNAQVFITTVNFGAQVSVQGAVRQPGVQSLDRPTRLAEAVSRAGGAAQPNGVIVVRRRAARGATQLQRFDQAAVLAGRSNPMIYNGDQIYVEEAPVFYLYGYVNRPGVYPLVRPITIQQALASGGGIGELGSEWRIDIKRVQNGQMQVIPANLDEPVKANDTIVVKERFF